MKIIIAALTVAAALVFGATSFIETSVQYADFQTAMTTHKYVQVKGTWLTEKESSFDAAAGIFSFFMMDEQNKEMKVVFDGAKPNNFEIAHAVVVKGRYENGSFHATQILTKCPSKYEADTKTGQQ